MAMKLNPDKVHRLYIIQKLKDNDGYCPCALVRSEDTKCMCKNMRENNKCCCDLYVEVEDGN